MEWFIAFKYLHIAAMFFAVGLAVTTEIGLRIVAGSADPRTIATATERLKPLGNVSTGLFLAGVAFGIVAALTGQINLLAPWLIAAYVAFVAAVAIGVLVTDPWVARLGTAAASSPEGAPSEALRTVIADPVARAGTWALMMLIAAIVFLMVVKPFA
jgi:hypothetical protein